MSDNIQTFGQLNAAPYPEARRWYAQHGMTLTGRPDESSGEAQPRCDLRGSNLIAAAIPSPQFHNREPRCGAVEALGDLSTVPAFERGAEVVVLFSAPGVPEDAPRNLTLDRTLGDAAACYRAVEGNLALPCAGSKERWVAMHPAPSAPPVLVACAQGLAGDGKQTDQAVTDWLLTMFEPSGPTGVGGFVARKRGDVVVGLSRQEVFDLLAKCTSWSTSDFSLERLSRCADIAGLTKHKTKSGYVWLIQRRPGVPLKEPNGADVSTIDPMLLELCRSIHLTREHSPQVRKQRTEEQAAAAARAERSAMILARYGSADIVDVIRRVEAHGQRNGNLGEHWERWEQGRHQACAAQALEWIPCPLSASKPEWWTQPAETPHDVRYRFVVRNFAQPTVEGRVA